MRTTTLAKLGAVAAVLFTLAGAAMPASADTFRGDMDYRDGRGIVRVDDRYGPPRVDHRRELLCREIQFRHDRFDRDHYRFEQHDRDHNGDGR